MKKHYLFLLLTTLFFQSFGQITVSSIDELIPYLSQDSVEVKLTPGTYTITEQDVVDRVYGAYETIDTKTCYTLFKFSGNGSTYDFTDVTINVDAKVFKSVGNYTFWEIRLHGNDNTLKNLTLIDVGTTADAPKKTANNIVMDGKNNVVEGFDVQSTGSYPYGYGDIFGKGGGPIINHRKHSAILIRGESNTLRNTKLVHKAYGHCVFFQAANNPTVEGCYIQGEMRTSDDMLTEEGTGTIGDEKGFMTVWDYKLPPGFMVALCEAGIRAYNAGITIVDGDTISRGSSNVTVKNTTVKNTRTACTLVHATGTQHIEGITSIGNENGFSIGKGQMINCKSDAAYGSAFSGENGVTGDVTIIAPENGYYNGSKAFANMSGGTVTLRTETTDLPADMYVKMGTFRSFRHQPGSKLMYQLDTIFSGATVYNHTSITVELAEGASNNDIHTCGEVIDYGSGNTVFALDDCEIGACNNTAALIEAECFDDFDGIVDEGESIGSIRNGYWAKYSDLNLTDMNAVNVTASSAGLGGTMEFRLDAVDGTLIGSVEIGITEAWDNWGVFSANIDRVEGIHDVYTVFTGGNGWLFNIDLFGFSEEVICNNTTTHIEAECFDNMFGVQTEGSSEGTLNVGWINNDDWTMYSNIDLSDMNSIKVRVSGKTTGSSIEVRLDAVDGDLIAELPISNTGGNQNWITDSINILATTGIHDVYLVFKGGSGYLYNINHFGFSEDQELITGASNTLDNYFIVYPNPTSNTLNLSNTVEYQVVNSFGQIILSGEGNQIDLSTQSKGIYILKADHKALKIIKQ